MKRTVISFAAGLALFTAQANTPEEAKEAAINTDKSQLEWVGEKVTGRHYGTVAIKEGALTVNNGKITGGTIVIDMTTITATDLDGEWKQKLEGHLKSPDFFSVTAGEDGKSYNTSTFQITKVKEQKGDNGNTHVITGNMTIKGITKEISFPARVTMEGNTLKAYASFELDRTQWDIRYGSGSFFDNLGDKTIYDNFQIKFSIEAAM